MAEALRQRRRSLRKLWIRKGRAGRDVERIRARAADLGLEVEELAADALARLAGDETRTQGLVLEAGPLPSVPLESLCAGEPPRLVLALDGVEDPRNLGAIARVADGAGARGLLLTERRSPPLGPAAVRASAGALEGLPVARVGNLPNALETLKAKGFWTFGADLQGDDLFGMPDRVLRGDVVVVLGGEGRGLRPGLRRRLDHVVRIPMRGRVASLNVATAAGLVAYEWVRRNAVSLREC